MKIAKTFRGGGGGYFLTHTADTSTSRPLPERLFVTMMFEYIGIARGAPPGRTNYVRRNLQGKVASAPQAKQESILGHFLLGGGDLEGGSGSCSSFEGVD